MTEAGWIHDPQPKHVCITPTQVELDKRLEGAIWCCGTCGAYYEVFFDLEGEWANGQKKVRLISPVLVQERMATSSG